MVNILSLIFSVFTFFSFGKADSTPSHCHATDHDIQHSGHSHGDHSMAMYFNWRTREYFLIKQWFTSSTSSYVASLLVLFLLCIGNEYLRNLRNSYEVKSADLIVASTNPEKTTNGNTGPAEHQMRFRRRRRILLAKRFILSFLQTFLSYSLMLTTMTFNIGVVISICLGLSTGSLLFPFKNSTAEKEHCC